MGMLDWLKQFVLGAPRRAAGTSPFAPGTGPARLLIMRHAEKTGDKRDPHLSEAGQQRAGKLAAYIPEQFGKPDFLIAAKTSKRSRRPVETLEPLATALGLNTADHLDDEEVDDLVKSLAEDPAYKAKFGVVSWRHSDIPRLIAALGAPDGSTPAEWDEAIYNIAYDMTFRDGAPPEVRKIVQPF